MNETKSEQAELKPTVISTMIVAPGIQLPICVTTVVDVIKDHTHTTAYELIDGDPQENLCNIRHKPSDKLFGLHTELVRMASMYGVKHLKKVGFSSVDDVTQQ